MQGLAKLISMTPPSAGLFAATSQSARNPAIALQGKALKTTNAETVDSSKTLVQGRDRAAARSHRARAGASTDERSDASGAQGEGPADAAHIRVCDERAARQGELLLERYRLLERLGAGGFGVVWRAHDEQLDRTVALKRIPLPCEENRERAAREALLTARLSHPAIVALYEASADEQAFYLISELVEGDTLGLLIAEDQISDEEVLEIGLALVGALEHAHARGVIHRDVKPQNVLVPNEAAEPTPARGATRVVAKLADFGGARLAGDDALTRTGDVFGTLAYMAPEQSEGEEVGPPADLYSLALVLYEALSGVNPVRGRTAAATARRIGTPIESLARRRRDLPRELTRALDLALAPDPDRRGTLADLHDALANARARGTRRRLLTTRKASREPLATGPPSAHSSAGQLRSSQRPELHAHAADPHAHAAELHAHPAGYPDALSAPAVRRRSRDADLPLGDALEEPVGEAPRRRRIALPRVLWLGGLLAAAGWQAAQGRVGVSLLVLAAGAPLTALPRRSGPGWLAASLAPALGLVGLAGAFPALAGQRTDWRARAGSAALGFWWLALSESLLAKRLWLGPPSGLPPRVVWEASLGNTATHVIAATLTVELLIGAVVWALAAIVLPWIVRGRSAAIDVFAAVAWTIVLLAAVPLLERALISHTSQPSPRGALLGAALGCALAVCARALRGPV